MLNNNYLTFGNSILQKYCGMTSRINPLALIFLQKEEEEEAPQMSPATILNVQNYHYRTNRYIYNHIVNRYVQNYNQIVSVLRANTIYAESPNFKLDIHPVQMNHTAVQTIQETETVVKQVTEQLLKEYVRVDQIQEKTTEVIIKKLTEGLSSEGLKLLPLKVREKVFSEITKEVQEKVLPTVRVQTDSTALTDQTAKVLRQTIETVLEQNAGRLPGAVIAETAAGVTKELSVRLTKEWRTIVEAAEKQTATAGKQSTGQTTEKQTTNTVEKHTEHTISNLLVRQIEPYIMALSPGTSRSVIRQEILKVCQRGQAVQILAQELEKLGGTGVTGAAESQNQTTVIRRTIQQLLQEIAEHTDTCRRGKEKFDRQVVSRLTPLPVRPVALEFRKEQQEPEDASEEQLTVKKETTVLQQKVVQMIRKEQTAERKYYTHFVDKFLKASKEQEREEIDRSTLPAGIIYHQRPKETVQFVNRDVIRLPLEMLPQNQAVSLQEREPGSERSPRETGRGETHRQEAVRQETVRQEIVVQETIRQEAVRIENNVIREINKEMEKEIITYPEHTERRVIRRSVPEFTARGNSPAGQDIVMIEKPSMNRSAAGYWKTEGAAFGRSGTLELILLTQEGQEQEAYAAGNGSTVQSRFYAQGAIQYPQAAVSSAQGSRVAPMELLHRREEAKKDEQEEETAPRSPKVTEIVQPDIVFTKEFVTKQNIENVITENERRQQQVFTTGQTAGGMMSGQGQSMTNEPADILPREQMTAVRMERMISESVSRRVDENIPEITRQVYRNLERQIKKEQERRGI